MSRSKCLLNLTDSFRYFLLNCIKMGPPFRVKELLQSKQSDLPTRSSSNEEDQAQLQVKNCGKALPKCPETGSMTKELDGLPSFTFNSIVRHLRKSGKRMKKCAEYMVIKPFERAVNFCVEGYLHSVFVKNCIDEHCFFVRACCYRSLRKSEMPHKIKLCICTQPSYDVLGSSCTCIAGAVGVCYHSDNPLFIGQYEEDTR